MSYLVAPPCSLASIIKWKAAQRVPNMVTSQGAEVAAKAKAKQAFS